MNSKGDYFQFPLCVLAMKLAPAEIAAHIISYGIGRAGRARLEKLDADARAAACAEFGISRPNRNSHELALRLGAEVCGVVVHSVAHSQRQYQVVERHVSSWAATYGKSAQVRLKSDLVFEMRDGGRITWREFRVLAAIYSVIGDKEYPVAIALKTIGYRHCGFLSFESQCRGEEAGDCPDELTRKQLRGTVEKLWLQRWFARVTPDPHGRVTYFSHRMTDDQLREAVFRKLTFKARAIAERRAKDLQFARRIQEAKGALHGGARAKDGAIATANDPAPQGPRLVTVKAPDGHQDGHREGTFNRNSLNKNSFNRNGGGGGNAPNGNLMSAATAARVSEEFAKARQLLV